jgi:hypothetical protein
MEMFSSNQSYLPGYDSLYKWNRILTNSYSLWCGTVAECGSLDVDHVPYLWVYSAHKLYIEITASERPRSSDVRCCIWLYVFSIISM